MSPPTVALCTVTYLRPVGLARLLSHVSRLERGDAELRVIVIDNDAQRSAEPVVEAARTDRGLDITYAVEPHRGITYARNRALDVALASGPDFIGWIDDDEAPRADWLVRVLETLRTSDADVVTGPWEPNFDDDAPAWIVDSRAFHAEHFAHGEPFPFFHTRTSGVILRSSAVPAERFDDRLALTGGEDRLFFTRVHRAGGRFVWDDLAFVDEWVPTSRVTVVWLLRRWFRTGITRSLTMVYLDHPGWPRRLRRVAGGLAMAARGLLETLISIPRGRSAILGASRRIMLGLGASYGACGWHLHEYRRVHGQ